MTKNGARGRSLLFCFFCAYGRVAQRPMLRHRQEDAGDRGGLHSFRNAFNNSINVQSSLSRRLSKIAQPGEMLQKRPPAQGGVMLLDNNQKWSRLTISAADCGAIFL